MSSRRAIEAALIDAAKRLCQVDSTKPEGQQEFIAAYQELCSWASAHDGLGLVNPEIDTPGNLPANPSDTQIAAAIRITPKRGSLRWKILELLWAQRHEAEGDQGLTDRDLEDITQRRHVSVSSARNDLVRYGWVKPTTRTRSYGDYESTVWDFTQLGRATWIELMKESER